MTRKQLVSRFGEEIGNEVKLDHAPKSLRDDQDVKLGPEHEAFLKATVYEVWDKEGREVLWIAKGYTERPLDRRPDPLNLQSFFPCPRPLYSSKTNDKLVPMADAKQYEAQAKEIDEITERIGLLTEAVVVRGVYDSSVEELRQLLTRKAQNKLIPVDNWQAFAESGGFKGAIDFFPLDEVVNALQVLYQARDRVKADSYEISGISDLVRGATDPRETATAQERKAQYANLRLKKKQQNVQRFVRDVVAIMGEIIAEQFSPETLYKMTGTDFLPDEMKSRFEEAVELLRDDAMRTYRIDIETDSTIAVDENLEKEQRVEFLSAVGSFIQQAQMLAGAVPELTPTLGEMMLFGVRAFKSGRQLEGSLQAAIDRINDRVQQQLENPQQPPPDPAALKLELEQQLAQAKLQLDQQKQQIEMQAEQANAQIKTAQLELEREKLTLDAQLKREEMANKAQIEAAKSRADLAEQQLRLAVQQAGRNAPSVNVVDGKAIALNRPRRRVVQLSNGLSGEIVDYYQEDEIEQ